VNDEEKVHEAEVALLTPAVRCDPDRLRAALAEDFVEIGRTGRLWTRDMVIDALGDELERGTPETEEWAFTRLSPELMLVTYVIRAAQGPDSRHASVWDLSGDQPVIRFHQGTIVA